MRGVDMDELPPEVRGLIGRSRGADEPSTDDKARVRSKLVAAGLPALGSAGLAAKAAAATSAKSGAITLAALGKWLAIPVAVGAMTWAAVDHQATLGDVPAGNARAADSAAEGRAQPKSSEREETTRLSQETSHLVAAPVAHQRAGKLGAHGAERKVARVESGSRGRADSAQSPRPGPTEVELLAEAQRRLSQGDAPRALELAYQHRARYPSSALRAERLAVEVLASCGLNQRAQAEHALRQFLRVAPSSPLRPRLEASCASEVLRGDDGLTIPPLTGN